MSTKAFLLWILVIFILAYGCTPHHAEPDPYDLELELDRMIYDNCVTKLPDAVTVEYAANSGEPDHYTIDLGEFVLCGDYVSDFTMKDLNALTKITYTSSFTVITPDGETIESPLESSVSWKVYDPTGTYFSYYVEETYSITGLTGYSKIDLPACGDPLVGTPGTLTIFRCDPK